MIVLSVVVILGLFVSCDEIFGPQRDDEADDFLRAERGSSVSLPEHGALAAGERVILAYSTAPPGAKDIGPGLQKRFVLQNAGNVRIDYWGISLVVTPYEDQEMLSITHAFDGSSFSLNPGEEMDFYLVAADPFTTVSTAGVMELTISISNKFDVTPNPYVFYVLIEGFP
jgi:hypothetical protein